jgi:hypothetical protein
MIPGYWQTVTSYDVSPINLGQFGAFQYQNYQGQRLAQQLVLQTATALHLTINKIACTKSPGGAVLEGAIGGALKVGSYGVYKGFEGGEIAEPFGGGVPGAAIGGFLGTTTGAAGGIIVGSMTAAGCSALGIYD